MNKLIANRHQDYLIQKLRNQRQWLLIQYINNPSDVLQMKILQIEKFIYEYKMENENRFQWI